MRRCWGPEPPRSVHKTHRKYPPLKLSFSAQPVEAGPRSVNEPPRATLRRFAEVEPSVPPVNPEVRVKDTPFRSCPALFGSARLFERVTVTKPFPTVKVAFALTLPSGTVAPGTGGASLR